MKKIYLMALAAFAMSTGSMAQRNIDWSVEEIIKPTEIESNTSTGSTFDIEVVFKNNGSGAVVSGDTVIYNVVFLNAADQLLFAYPGPTNFQSATSTRAFAVGDTMHAHIRLTFPQYPIASVNTKLRIASLVINRGSNKIADEPSASQANNVKIKEMTWWNPQRFGVGIEEVSSALLMDIFPNPAQNVVTISYKMLSAVSPNEVNIFNLQGQLVHSFTSELGAPSDQIDISALPAGIYVVKVKSGDFEAQQKLQIVK